MAIPSSNHEASSDHPVQGYQHLARVQTIQSHHIAQEAGTPPPQYHPSNYETFFPPLPTYPPGPLPFTTKLKYTTIQALSSILYTLGIFITVLCALPTIISNSIRPDPKRPFLEEENRRAEARNEESRLWKEYEEAKVAGDISNLRTERLDMLESELRQRHSGYLPSAGGEDKIIRDVAYYARRVGLDSEEVKIKSEDGLVLVLWHVFDPVDRVDSSSSSSEENGEGGGRGDRGKYPVLMIHGLLQSAGVYCTNDESSLAFWLCKEGFDVWLGNCRVGFEPEHREFGRADARVWNWDLRHMATYDLPAMTNHVLSTTRSPDLALMAHNQGTATTLIALSRYGCPSLSSKISVACFLAPAFYGGKLLTSRFHFRFMRLIPRKAFTLLFGRGAFLPIMGTISSLRGIVPEKWIGSPSYAVYRFFFNWSDNNWDRGVRDRSFMFAPTFISAKAMGWWLARGGFADRGCVLSTAEEVQREDIQDLLSDHEAGLNGSISAVEANLWRERLRRNEEKAVVSEPWFPAKTPPLAFWVAENDLLVDGKKLLNRFRRGREPNAKVVFERVVEGYEHLDVVWSCDVIEKVGWEVRDVIRETVNKSQSAQSCT